MTRGLVHISRALILGISGMFGGQSLAPGAEDTGTPSRANDTLPWELVWADEFNAPAGTPPDAEKWVYDLGAGGDNPGWGNNELQIYSNSTENVFHDGNGHLIIRATATRDGGFHSGRIKTQSKFTFTYGRVEAAIRIPYAQGLWPAFWALGADYPDTPWPLCGEIDVMENFGPANDDRRRSHATAHGPGYSGAGISSSVASETALSDRFHVYAMEWEPDSIRFFLDGREFFVVSPALLPPDTTWVFNDRPFFLLLNLAVGGFPAPVGYPDASTVFPQQMAMDYVRVYRKYR